METSTQNRTLSIFSFQDYTAMFALNKQDLGKKIFDYSDGIDSFNAEMHADGREVISSSPFYQTPPAQVVIALAKILPRLEPNAQAKKIIDKFSHDYTLGKQQKRYLDEVLPHLSFKPFQFDLALCAYHFFLQQEQNLDYYLAAALELARVAKEIRIFPLINAQNQVSPLLGPLMLRLQQHNFGVEVKQVAYQKEEKSSAMLRIWANACEL